MGDVIDFTRKNRELEIEVDLNDDDKAQRILEIGIVALWDMAGGFDLQKIVDNSVYHLLFLSFSGVCFEQMTEGNIIVTEDSDVAIDSELREVLFDAIKDAKAEFATNDNSPE